MIGKMISISLSYFCLISIFLHLSLSLIFNNIFFKNKQIKKLYDAILKFFLIKDLTKFHFQDLLKLDLIPLKNLLKSYILRKNNQREREDGNNL